MSCSEVQQNHLFPLLLDIFFSIHLVILSPCAELHAANLVISVTAVQYLSQREQTSLGFTRLTVQICRWGNASSSSKSYQAPQSLGVITMKAV